MLSLKVVEKRGRGACWSDAADVCQPPIIDGPAAALHSLAETEPIPAGLQAKGL